LCEKHVVVQLGKVHSAHHLGRVPNVVALSGWQNDWKIHQNFENLLPEMQCGATFSKNCVHS